MCAGWIAFKRLLVKVEMGGVWMGCGREWVVDVRDVAAGEKIGQGEKGEGSWSCRFMPWTHSISGVLAPTVAGTVHTTAEANSSH